MKKKPLVNKIFLENRSMLEEIMKEKKISKNNIISDLTTYLNGLYADLHLEYKDKPFKIKEVSEYLPVKLGWYELLDKSSNPEMIVEQCTLTPTQKGREIYAEYKKLNIKSNLGSIILGVIISGI